MVCFFYSIFFKGKTKENSFQKKSKEPYVVEWQRIASAARFNISTADDNGEGGKITEKTC